MPAELVSTDEWSGWSPARWARFLCEADAGPKPRLICTGLCAALALTALFPGLPTPLAWLAIAGSYIAGGLRTALSAVKSIRTGTPDINFLMILAAVVSALIGHWGEGAILLFLFSLSDALERYAVERTRAGIRGLMKLRPERAHLVRDSVEKDVPAEQLVPGDQVRVRPGERFPVDGTVIDGNSSVDQAIVTGESMPVDKSPGDEVFAGTINANGALLVRMTRPAVESTLARIVRMVEEAQERKAPFERFIDKFQKPYVISVLVACALVIFVKLIASSGNFDYAIYSGMVLLVAASPCAIVLASPVAVLATLTRAARGGVLYKGGALIEQVAQIGTIAFDKTGTLTVGRPTVARVLPVEGTGESELLAVAAAVEQLAEHPLARAIVTEAQRRKLTVEAATNFRSDPGIGVSAEIGGKPVRIVRPAALSGLAEPRDAELRQLISQVADATAVVVVQTGGCAGVITFQDQARPEAVMGLNALRALGIRHFVMLTGDHSGPAKQVGAQLGIESVMAELLPHEKVREVHRLARSNSGVIMVGDGVNDAPALAAATVGVAMGAAGTDVAIETADVVLMRSDLRTLAEAIFLARRCRTAIRRGLLIAGGAILLLVSASLFGLPLPLAVIGHEGSTVVVILSGLSVLNSRRTALEPV